MKISDYASENSAFESSPLPSVSNSANWLINFASTAASLWLIVPLPSTSKVSKSVPANAADEDVVAAADDDDGAAVDVEGGGSIKYLALDASVSKGVPYAV